MTSFDEIIENGCYGVQYVFNFNPIVDGKGAARFEKNVEDLAKSSGEFVFMFDDNPIFGQPRWLKSDSPKTANGYTTLMFENLDEKSAESFFYICKSDTKGLLAKISGDGKVIIPLGYKSDEFKIEKIERKKEIINEKEYYVPVEEIIYEQYLLEYV
jgi:hypothetical protein